MTTTPARRHSPVALYEAALGGLPVVALDGAGARPLDVRTWGARATPEDDVLLARCEGPVLDVGCGPGRLAAELARRGVACLGIDVSPGAVARARAQGAVALRRAVESALPGEGRWATVLLADGNIGIGGDPAALLARCRELVRPDGAVLVETDPDPDARDTSPVVLRAADGRLSRPLPWARLGARPLRGVAAGAGLDAAEEWTAAGRTVVVLRPTD
ncbi:class I SAM-dependent methyltransferase [Cellulosimicrobium marinum]|uniref:class I SAM-dependent methyltransferase n=1 Tax=Cellulosimicrobium marinum TaxID=1638992 RepID=UPI001E5C4EEC|nr:class I SAM-dependent methyltransferase [Cellulosimicrobium marinum]MCB7135891.1 methyltransferase domain-containing protein [Cellulosimicrobium marinum]